MAAGSRVGRRPGPRPVVGAHRGDDLARHRLVAGAAAAVDHDVGLGVDRASGGVERSASTPRGSGACRSGRPGRSRTRSQSRSRSARIQTEVACALISARVRGSMKAPPPVARTRGRSARRRAITRRSPSRKAGSPRVAKISGIVMPAAAAISASESVKGDAEERRQPLADAGLARPHQPDQHQGAVEPRAGSGGRAGPARVAVSRSSQLPCGRARAKLRDEAIAAAGQCRPVIEQFTMRRQAGTGRAGQDAAGLQD